MQCQKYLKFPLVSGDYFVPKQLVQANIRGHKFRLKLKSEGWSLQGTISELWGLLEATAREAVNSAESLPLSTDSEQDYKLEGKNICCLWPKDLNSPPPT